MNDEVRNKVSGSYKSMSMKKIIIIAVIVVVILAVCSPVLLRACVSFGINFGTWSEIYGDNKASSGKTKFYSDGVWIESYDDGSGSDGEWKILSDFTFVYDNGYDVTYYQFGDWLWVGTHLFLGEDYQFTRVPFFYPEG